MTDSRPTSLIHIHYCWEGPGGVRDCAPHYPGRTKDERRKDGVELNFFPRIGYDAIPRNGVKFDFESTSFRVFLYSVLF